MMMKSTINPPSSELSNSLEKALTMAAIETSASTLANLGISGFIKPDQLQTPPPFKEKKIRVFYNSQRKHDAQQRKQEHLKNERTAIKALYKKAVQEVKIAEAFRLKTIYETNRYELLPIEIEEHIEYVPFKKVKSTRIHKLKSFFNKTKIFKTKIKIDHPAIFTQPGYKHARAYKTFQIRGNEFTLKKIPKSVSFHKDTIFHDQAFDISAMMNTFKDFICQNVFTACANITMDTFLESLEKLKPINLSNLFAQALSAKTWTQLISVIIAGFELYGFFWKCQQQEYMIYIFMLAYFLAYLIRCIKGEDFEDQANFVPTDDDSKIRSWMQDNLNINLSNIPSEVMPIVTGVIAFIAIITGGTFINWADLNFSKIIKRFKNFGSLLKTVQSYTDMVPKVFLSMMSAIAGLFGYDYVSDEDQVVLDFKKNLLDFKKEVTTLTDLMMIEPTTLIRNPALISTCEDSMKNLDKQYEELMKQKFNTAQVKLIFDDIKTCVKKIHNWARTYKQSSPTKIEPTFIQFSGLPGVGKSKLVSYVIKKLEKKLDRQLVAWTRQSTEKFWSGYAGQDVIIFDEFNQDKKDDDHADIMKFKNPNKCQVNMADVADKGMPFSSLFVFACSNNLDIISSAQVKTAEALNRRRDGLFFIHDPCMEDFKQEFGKFPGSYVDADGTVGKPNVTRIVDGEPITMPYFDPEFQHLQIFHVPSLPDFRSGDPKEVDIDYIVDLAYGNYLKYTEAYEVSLINVDLLENNVMVEAVGDWSEKTTSSSFYSDRRKEKADSYREALSLFTHKEASNKFTPIPSTSETLEEIRRVYQEVYTHDDDYIDQSAESTATAFCSAAGDKGKIFSCSGPPGTGKSRIFDFVQASYGEHCQRIHSNDLINFRATKPVLIIDDISLTKVNFQLAKALIAQVYDGQHTIKRMYVNFNMELLSAHCINDEDRDLFLRRLTRFEFQFKKKTNNWVCKDDYYNAEDIEEGKLSYALMVKIFKWPDLVQPLDYLDVVKELKHVDIDYSTVKKKICMSAPYFNPNAINADFIVTCHLPLYQFCGVLYENPSKILRWLVDGTVNLIKGGALEGVRVAQQFASPITDVRPFYPDDINSFVCMINNVGFTSDVPFVTHIRCVDQSLIIMPKKEDPKLIRAFLSSESIAFDDAGNVIDDDGSYKMNYDTKEEFKEYFNFIHDRATELRAQMELAEEEARQATGFAALLIKCPALKYALSVASFYLRFVLAGVAITSLTQYHFTNGLQEKIKIIDDTLLNESKKRKPRINQFIYDSARDDISLYGNKTAKQTDLQTLWTGAYVKHGRDYTREEFHEYIKHYKEDESRDVSNNPVPIPQLENLIDPLLLESRDVQNNPVPIPQLENLLDPLLLDEKAKSTIFLDESLLDPSTSNIVNMVARNTIDIVRCKDGNDIHLVYGLMIKGRRGVSVNHFAEANVEYFAKVRVSGEVKKYPIKFTGRSEPSDLLIFEINSKECPMFRSIVSHLPTQKTNISQISRAQNGILVTTDFNDKDGSIEKLLRNVSYDDVGEIKTKQTKTGLEYHGVITHVRTAGLITTQPGDCGSVTILCNNATNVKILGVHNAGSTTSGFCSLIFQEYFSNYNPHSLADEAADPITTYKHNCVELREHETQSLCGMPVVAEGLIKVILPNKTKLWTSPLKLPGESIVQPAILSPYDSRNKDNVHPFYKSVEKWAHVQPVVDTILLDRAIDDVAEWYARTCEQEGLYCDVLTKTTALNAGIEQGMNQLNRNSSPGYPWTQYHGKKNQFLEIHKRGDDKFWAINRNDVGGMALCVAIDQLINSCNTEKLIKPCVPFAGHIKDEPVKMDKIFDVNSRSFAGAPFEYVVASRMYFGAAMGALHKVRHLIPSQIGINPTSLEWHRLVTDLLEVSDIGFDADYKNFDATVLHEVMSRLDRVYNRIYQLCDPNWKIQDDWIRSNLNNALVKPLLVIPHEGGKVYIVEASGGQVSGQPRTADDNCIVNLVYLYMHWLEVFKNEPQMCNIQAFLHNVRAELYGDDGCIAVSPEVIHRYNCKTFSDFMLTLNVTVTDAAKSKNIKPWIRVEQFEFLKRRFVKKGMYWFGPLVEKSFSKMMDYTLGPAHHWDKEPTVEHNNIAVIESTMESCLQEAVFHGPAFYNQMKNHCLKYCKKFRRQWIPLNYNAMVQFKNVPLPRE